MDPGKVQAVQDWPVPQNRTEVRGFLGLTGFYRAFIRSYGALALPITQLLRKEQDFKWGPEQQEAFQRLKDAITTQPVLAMPDPEQQFELETDASDYALGAQLGQRDNQGKVKPVAYYSKKLDNTQRNYQIHDKELMAIVEAFRTWRQYLSGARHPVKVYTDHKNLAQFTTTKTLNKRQVRWAEFLAEFDFTIQYRKGSENGRADALSRRPDHYEEIQNTGAILKTNPDGTLTTQVKELGVVLTVREDSKLARAKDGRSIVEDQDAEAVVRRIHEAPAHGHQGIRKTSARVNRHYQVSNLREIVTRVVNECVTCGKVKAGRHKMYGELQPLPVAQGPWDSISMDFITKLPLSHEPLTETLYDSILVIVDRFTKYAIFLPYKEASGAQELAYTMLREVFSHHGLPGEIVSDRDRKFVSKFWQALVRRLGVKHKMSTAYHPQTDGQTERTNQTLEQYLRAYVNYPQDDWVQHLPLAQFAYNSAVTETTKVTPYYANYGYEPTAYREAGEESRNPRAEAWADKQQGIMETVRKELEFTRARMRKYTDRKRIPGPPIKVGDKVYLLRRNIRTKRPSEKLDYRKLGPFKIKRKLSDVTYELQLPDGMRRIHPVFHVSLLEKAPSRASCGQQEINEQQNQEEEYEVEEILDSRKGNGPETEYLIKWKGYGHEENTWEPETNLANSGRLLKEFLRRNPDRPGNRGTQGSREERRAARESSRTG